MAMENRNWGKQATSLSEPESLLALTSENEPVNPQRRLYTHQQSVMGMDIDGKSNSFHCSFLKPCVGICLMLIAAILVGFGISAVSLKRAGWSSLFELDTQKYYRHHQDFTGSASRHSVEKYLRMLTKSPHVAGSLEDLATAQYVKDLFESYGFRTASKDYDVLLSYPLKRSVTMLFPNGSDISLRLTEEPVNAKVIPPFHAYSPSGNITAEVVYANYGRQEDYFMLDTLNVSVKGKAVIVRYGEIFRGDTVAIAANAGAVAVILYSDPQDFSGGQKGGFFPDTRWLPPTGVQRGTVFQGSGDPSTPGWPSTSNGERLSDADVAAALPRIPSLPISASDALIIMSCLGGEIAPPDWHGALEIPHYRIDSGRVKLNLNYMEKLKISRIQNVFGVLEGAEEPDRFVILGNHRDAWTFGAVDPNSGSAALLEIARRLGILRQHGWQPRRSILLCSWDAEEYGLVGSTEWVEQNAGQLVLKAVAYLNVDCAVAGPGFYAAATPQLDVLLKEVAKEIQDPDTQGESVYDSWAASSGQEPMLTRLGGGGSDFTAFLQHVGIPSMDIYFGKDYPVYHSLYDTLQWLENFGDPSFKRLLTASTIWGLVGLHLADSLIIPFKYGNYADELEFYTKAVENRVATSGHIQNVRMDPVWSAIQKFRAAITLVEHEIKILGNERADLKSVDRHALLVRMLNERLIQTERAFIDNEGWHRHLVYGRSKSDKYEGAFFPGVNRAISLSLANGHWNLVQHEVWKIARAIERAALIIVGQLV